MRNDKIEEIYLEPEVERLFEYNLTLNLLDIPTEKELEKIKKIQLSENHIWVFARGYNDHIKIGSTFDAVFPRKNPLEGTSTKGIIRYISVNPKYESEYLPKGYSGLCLIEFLSGVPDLMQKLPMYGEKRDLTKHDILILTQQNPYEKVRERFNKTLG